MTESCTFVIGDGAWGPQGCKVCHGTKIVAETRATAGEVVQVYTSTWVPCRYCTDQPLADKIKQLEGRQ